MSFEPRKDTDILVEFVATAVVHTLFWFIAGAVAVVGGYVLARAANVVLDVATFDQGMWLVLGCGLPLFILTLWVLYRWRKRRQQGTV